MKLHCYSAAFVKAANSDLGKRVRFLALCAVAVLFLGEVRAASDISTPAAWRTENFGANMATVNVAGDLADPDTDGVSNLMEYALGLDPNQFSATGLPVVAAGVIAGVDSLTITYRKVRSDVSYTVEVSTDLTAWNPVADAANGQDNGVELRRAVVPKDGGPKFLRLRVASVVLPLSPVAPSALAATATSTSQINLTWTDNSTDETGFEIERKTGAGGVFSQIAAVASGSTSYSNTGLSTFTNYVYRVRATNTGGNSDYTPEVAATTLDTIPAIPSGLALSGVTAAHIKLTWVDNSNGATGNETSFKIERRTGANGSYAQIATVGANVTTYDDNSPASATVYYYRVRASNSGGNSNYSNAPSATTLGTAVAAPTSLTLTLVDSDEMDLSWTDGSSNETGFVIERSTSSSPDSFAQVAIVGAGVTSYRDSSLDPITTYYYRVRATMDGTSNSGFTTVVSRKTMIPEPTNVVVTVVSATQVNLTWTDNSTNETGFSVERKTGADGVYSQTGSVDSNMTTYTNNGLVADTDYFYRIRVPLIPFGTSSDKSIYSPEVNFMILPSPVLTAAVGSSSRIDLSWTDPSLNETGFKIERRPDSGGAFVQIAVVGPDTTTYSDNDLPANTGYVYRVQSFRGSTGASPYSNLTSVITGLGGGLPSPWVDQDIGSPASVGSASYSSGVYTIRGSGSDIWGAADNFHYVYRPLNGNGTVVARMTGLELTREWAKAGVMIRETLAAGSKHAFMGVTPNNGHGTSFFYRSSTGGVTTAVTPNDGVGPVCWVKLTRSGDAFTGYRSVDGTNWTTVGTISIPMTTGVYVGLPVCSLVTALCKATVDNVGLATASIPAAPAAAGTPVATVMGANQINLSWADNSSNEAGFRIERKTGAGGAYATIATTAAGATTFSNGGLASGTTYYYRVVAFNDGGDSASSGEVSGTTTGGPTPSLISEDKPTTASSVESGHDPFDANDGNLTSTRWTASNGTYPQWWKVDLGASYSLMKVKIAWYNASSRSYKYKIEVSNNDSTYTTVVDKSNNTTVGESSDAFSATARYVRITVSGSSYAGGFAGFYECRVYRNGSEPTAASGLTATAVTANQINLSWTDTSSNESGFKIERKTGSTGSYAQVGIAAAGATTYRDYSLAAGTQYYYQVRSYSDFDGDSIEYSGEASATTPVAGLFTRAYWTNVTGTDVAALTSDARYPTSPTGSGKLNNFEAPADWGDNFGAMISGLVKPPTTGNYTFWISSNDTSELWLSTDTDPANVVQIAKVEDKASVRDWIKHSTQKSASIPLVGGQSYYIRALHKESSNGTVGVNFGVDHVEVAWEGPGFSRQVMSDSGSPLYLSIVSPVAGEKFSEGSNITIDASATPGSGRSIVKVEFLVNLDTKNELKLGEDVTAPYGYTWNNVGSGSYTLIARAWDSSGVSADRTVRVMVTNASFGSGAWAEKILNGDGSINWTEYVNVANNYDRRDMLEYRFGPTYDFYHPTPEVFSTLPTQAGENGVTGHPYVSGNETDWYSEGGQMTFSPNASAPARYQPGVAQALNGDVYTFSDTPPYCFVNGVQWNQGVAAEPAHGQQMPDPSVKRPAFIAANGGVIPAPPIAAVRTGGLGGITGFLLFKNGFITGAGNGATDSYYSGDGFPYPFIQLAPGKVPTAGAVTINTEFLLVTVWDTINRKGQLAVLSVDGQIRAQQNASNQEYFWGLPNRFKVKALKVLGYVDLPFSAPSAIKVSNDMAQKDGVGAVDNINLSALLNAQGERDSWYAWSGHYKKTSKSGYAVIASRAENKVAFVDLQPLFEYYRQMYFTSQANYDLTKNQGSGADQWPFTFSYAPEQTPTVAQTISVNQPTALFAGMPQNPNGGSGSTNGYKTNCYIGTMDGQLLIYNIGDLMTTASGGSVGAPVSIPIGRNPTSIDNALEFFAGTVINCRGDKKIHIIDPAGTILSTLQDSRLQDPVYTAISQNGRLSYGTNLLHVMDFEGCQIMTYRFGGATAYPPITEPTKFEFTHKDPLPGAPFMFNRCGVN